MAVLLAVTAVLLYHSSIDIWIDSSVLVMVRWEISVLPSVTALLIHHSAMDTWTDCSVVSPG